MFSKKDLADQATRDAFQQLSGKAEMLTRLGRLLLDTALTLEIMDRMGLTDEECRYLEGDQVALYFKGFYDRFTRYIRENAISVEYLQYPQFIRQLHKSELFVETKTVRFGDGEPRRASVLDFPTIQQKCDVDGFIKSQARGL